MKLLLIIVLLISNNCVTPDAPYPDNKKRAKILLGINESRVSIFVNSIYTDAEAVSHKTKVPIELIIAEACHQSNFGEQENFRAINNILSIKGGLFKSQKECFEYFVARLLECEHNNLDGITLYDWVYKYKCCENLSQEHSSSIRRIIDKYLN